MNKAKEFKDIFDQLQNDSSNEDINKAFHESFVLVDQLLRKQGNLERISEEHMNKLKQGCSQSSEFAKEATAKINKRYNDQMKTLRENQKTEEQKLSKETNVLEEITNKMHNVALDEESLSKKEVELKNKKAIDIEREKAKFKLLTNTLKIKWDYTCQKDKVKGYVSGKSPTPFSVNQKEHSCYYTANYLWDLIELTN